MAVTPGAQFGRYKVRSQLGAGGMGEVYLAEDTELERTVALKVLPEQVAADKERMQRFVQEAKAASALNHPNILTIYEIGRADSARFIATEFINGATLRQQIAARQISLSDALNIAIQIADALAAAHAVGIVHRDIKPDNVMVRPDGYVKVLDFGLAKLTEREAADADTEAPTRALVNTGAGVVMGTASYMSPEQARGVQVDPRTDIWSLGCVLYEMVAGRSPFEGATVTDVLAAILNKEPAPLARYQRNVPEALEWIVTKALTKDRDGRYQTAKEFFTDLRRLRQRLEFEAEMERSVAPELLSSLASGETSIMRATNVPSPLAPQTLSAQTPAETVMSEAAARTAEVGSKQPTTSAEYLVQEIRRHKSGAIILSVLAIALIGGLALGLHKFFNSKKSFVPFQNMKVTKLTTTGKVTLAAISPEGKYVVHVIDDFGKQSLWVRQVATTSNVQIVAPAEISYRGMTFSPDGDFIYYTAYENNNPEGFIYQIPVLGGTPKRLVEDVDSSPTISPDGKRLVYIRSYPKQAEQALFISNADGTNEQRVATRKSPQGFLWGTGIGPAWSPDGKVIACSVVDVDSGGPYQTVAEVRVEGGATQPITTQKWQWSGQVAWLGDGSGLIVVAGERGSNATGQIWNISYPGGEVRRVTNDLNNYRNVSLTAAESRALVTVQIEGRWSIWVAANGDASVARKVTSGNADGAWGIALAPDGRIVYTSNTNGNVDIWIGDADGSNQKQLTFNAEADTSPNVTADGRYIVFQSSHGDASRRPHLWRMDMDGGNLKQLTNSYVEVDPVCSPDSKWVIYAASTPGQRIVQRISIEGGEPVKLTEPGLLVNLPAISPDGKLIVYTVTDLDARKFRLAIVSFDGGQPTKLLDVPRTVGLPSPALWSSDGRSILYIDTREGVSNIWNQPIDGSSPRQLTNFTSDLIANFAWSHDGHQLTLVRGTRTSDVVLINDLR
ncbi:MAG TPA: protein kinase [Pyrinomonadaceae bacterium]|nr:protein kinase [Pyrinomonadaceae bacterium]